MSTVCFKVEILGSYKVITMMLPLLKTFWELFFWSWQFITPRDSVSLSHIPFVLTENIKAQIEHQYYSLSVTQNKFYFPKSNSPSNDEDLLPIKAFKKISQALKAIVEELQ